MAEPDLSDAILSLGRLLMAKVRADPELRSAVRRVVDELLDEPSATSAAASATSADSAVVEQTQIRIPVIEVMKEAEPLPPLTFPAPPPSVISASGSVQSAASLSPLVAAGAEVDLSRLVTRIEQRAERLREAGGAGSGDDDEIASAPSAERTLIVRGFENVAGALRLVKRTGESAGRGRAYQQAVELVAEALSALRLALEKVIDYPDADHTAAFAWLRHETRVYSIFVQRYMRLDDPADPEAWSALAERIAELAQPIESAKRRKALWGKLRYHLARLTPLPDGAEATDESLGDWRTCAAVTAELIRTGLSVGNAELRGAWTPWIDLVPESLSLPPEFEQFIREADELAAGEQTDHVLPDQPLHRTPEMEQVRAALAGRVLVVIGGDSRRHSIERLKKAFDLEDVEWVATRAHESHYHFEAAIKRPAVAVVLLLIRFISHSFAEVAAFCEQSGKPLVRIPGGYNEQVVARHIMDQAGKRLGIHSALETTREEA